MRLVGEKLELNSNEEICYLILISGGSCMLQWCDESILVNPGCTLLLGPGSGVLRQAGHTVAELSGCEFPVGALHELKNRSQKDLTALFEPGQTLPLYASVKRSNRLRTLLELMRSAGEEPDCPNELYLALLLYYVDLEYQNESRATAAPPRNETVEQVCAYLAVNYQQKFSLSEVAAKFYLSPYYLSRVFRRVTGQSIVDYLNARRIEAAQKLLETTNLSISAVAEQTGFASAAHFRRVFRETMNISPLQYRKSHQA